MDHNHYDDLSGCLRALSDDIANALDNIVCKPHNVRTYKIPMFEAGKLNGVKEVTRTDYDKVNREILYKSGIVDSPLFKAATTALVQIIEGMTGASKPGRGAGAERSTKKQVCNFVTQLARERQEQPKGAFCRANTRFCAHIKLDILAYTYITPLYNVDTGDSKIILSKKTQIRPITDSEYAHVIDIRRPLKEIEPYQRRLRLVMSYRADADQVRPLDDAKDEYALVTNLIRLGGKGAPEFGQIYQLRSTHLNVLNPRRAEPHESTPQPSGHAEMSEEDKRFIVLKYNYITSKLAQTNQSGFLASSISRFGMAGRHSQHSNRVVDYVIALESLLVESPGEITLKLAHRVSALCGRDDTERLFLWEFMRAVYKFRSGVVHNSIEKPVMVASYKMSVREASSRLHKITSDAILRIVDMLGTYKRQSDILRDLDRCVYDRKLMSELHEAREAAGRAAAGTGSKESHR